jgi:hypothetical protein
MAKYHSTPATTPAIDHMMTFAVSAPFHQIMPSVHATAKKMDAGNNRLVAFMAYHSSWAIPTTSRMSG